MCGKDFRWLGKRVSAESFPYLRGSLNLLSPTRHLRAGLSYPSLRCWACGQLKLLVFNSDHRLSNVDSWATAARIYVAKGTIL